MFIRLRNRFNVKANLERLDQARKSREFLREVVALTTDKQYSLGAVLWFCLPLAAARAIVDSGVDPYRVAFTEPQLLEWIENHVVFGEDIQIVAIHDYGTMLWMERPVSMEWYGTKENNNGY